MLMLVRTLLTVLNTGGDTCQRPHATAALRAVSPVRAKSPGTVGFNCDLGTDLPDSSGSTAGRGNWGKRGRGGWSGTHGTPGSFALLLSGEAGDGRTRLTSPNYGA